jgi:hypothetical protein
MWENLAALATRGVDKTRGRTAHCWEGDRAGGGGGCGVGGRGRGQPVQEVFRTPDDERQRLWFFLFFACMLEYVKIVSSTLDHNK